MCAFIQFPEKDYSENEKQSRGCGREKAVCAISFDHKGLKIDETEGHYKADQGVEREEAYVEQVENPAEFFGCNRFPLIGLLGLTDVAPFNIQKRDE